MTDVTPDLVRKLADYGRTRMISIRVDDVRDDVLDHAFDDLGFDGDEDALWEQVREAMSAGTTVSQMLQEQSNAESQNNTVKTAPPWDAAKDGEMVTAPFRFVPLNDKVSILKDTPCPHNMPKADRLSAVIDVDWQVETPLLIGETRESPNGTETVEPFRLGQSWAIPGSTLRGAIRSVVEIAAAGRLSQLNRHARFALRDFEHPRYKDFVQRTLGTPGLQAGWLTRIDGRPHITPCAWGYVRIADLVGSEDPSVTSRWAHKTRQAKYDDRNITWQDTGAFAPTQAKPFADAGEHQGKRLFRPGDSNRKGHLVVSGAIPGTGIVSKKYEYVFFDAGVDPVPISDLAWDVFETSNCKPSQNARKPDGSWKEFHGTYLKGGRVPVFYVGDLAQNATDREFSFGLTRLYRIPHARSIGDVLAESAPAHRVAAQAGALPDPDFVDALFGFVHEPKDLIAGLTAEAQVEERYDPKKLARKGRVTFEFAHPVDASAFRLWPDKPVTTIMGPPKPSFAPFYLEGVEKDYSAGGDVALAGRKRYLARHRPGQDGDPAKPLLEALRAQDADVSGDTKTHLRFLAPVGDARFRGRIRLHNASPAELGAILWALTFGGDPEARHLIGRGKPFGAGQTRVAALTLHVRRNAAWQTPEPPLRWEAAEGPEPLQPWFDAFGAEIAALTGMPGVAAWRQGPALKGLLEAARPRGWRDPRTTYLPYMYEGRQAKAFGELRKKTGIGVARNPAARRPPARLLRF